MIWMVRLGPATLPTSLTPPRSNYLPGHDLPVNRLMGSNLVWMPQSIVAATLAYNLGVSFPVSAALYQHGDCIFLSAHNKVVAHATSGVKGARWDGGFDVSAIVRGDLTRIRSPWETFDRLAASQNINLSRHRAAHRRTVRAGYRGISRTTRPPASSLGTEPGDHL